MLGVISFAEQSSLGVVPRGDVASILFPSVRLGGPIEGGRLGDEPSDVFIGERAGGGSRVLALPFSFL